MQTCFITFIFITFVLPSSQQDQIFQMGIKQGHQLVFKASNIVSCELCSMLEHVSSNDVVGNKHIDCDISNIVHQLSFRHSRVFTLSLVRDVAKFMKRLASDSSFIVTAIFDGDVRP